MTSSAFSRVGASLRHLDAMFWLTGLVAFLIYRIQGFTGLLSRDLGVYTYGGQQFADGVAPYVAILNRAGPLAHAVPGAGAWVGRHFGIGDVVSMRMTLMWVAIAAVMVVYLLGRDLFDSRAAGVASAAALLSYEGFATLATFGPREKTTMVLFVALALLAMVHQRWAISGAMIALATLTWQPAAFPTIAAVTVAALLGAGPSWRARGEAVLRMAMGGLLPTALIVLGYAAIGRLQVFWDCFFVINLRYTEQGGLTDNTDKLWDLMVKAYGWSLWVMLLGAVVMLGLGVAALGKLRGRKRDRARAAAVVGMGTHVAVCLLWSFKAFNGWPDVFFAFPATAVGIGGMFLVLAGRVPTWASVTAMAAWAATAAVMATSHAQLISHVHGLNRQRADVRLVMSLLPPDATVLSAEAPQALVLSHRTNPSRLQLFGNGLTDYVEDTWPGGMAGYAQWVSDQSPTVIAVGGYKSPRTTSWLQPVLEGHYQWVGYTPGPIKWFISTEVPREVRQEIADGLAEE